MKKVINFPIMTARSLEGGSAWYVILEWPNGRVRQVDGFQSELEAESWIKEESEIWLRKHASEHPDI